VPWPLWVYRGPPDVYRGPPEVYRGPCMKITPLNSPIISTNTVLANLPVSTVAPLQRVQNAAARLIKGLRPRDHVTSALRDLHWLPIRHRVTYKLCVLMHQVHIGSSHFDLLTPTIRYWPSVRTDINTHMYAIFRPYGIVVFP